MADKTYRYILDFKGKTDQISKDVGGLKGMLKGAAVAAGALFAADKIMDAAKAVADYAKQISHVRNEVTKLTGLQGAALDNMTGQVQAIAQAYDQDMNEVLRASNALMKTFGETNAATFAMMNSGFATTANTQGDFLQQVSEYSAHFKEAGLSASQMVAVIAEGNKMGVFNDKSADAIKEGGIRLREMTASTQAALQMIGLSSTTIQQAIQSGNMSMFDVMQLVSKQLQTLPAQSPAVGAALADIFGGPGEDAVQFIRNLADVNTNLSEVAAKSGEVSAAQADYTAKLAEFHTIGAQVFGGTGELITQVKAITMGWLNAAIKGTVAVINYFIDLYNESMIFRGVMEAVGLSVNSVFDTIKHTFSQLMNYFSGMGKLWKAIFEGDFGAIGGIISDTFNDIVDDAKEYGANLAENFNRAVENTISPKDKVKAITLSVDDANAAGVATGLAYANGLKTGMQMGRSGNLLPGMTPKKGFVQEMNPKGVTTYNEAITESNNSLIDSYIQLGQTAGNAMATLAGGADRATGSWLSFAGVIFAQIPVLIAQIMALTGAQVAASTTVVAAKQSEAMAGAAASGAILPFPANLIAMFTALGAVAAVFASIPKFALGGIVPGGSFGGDKVLIRANSGEEILRRDDPRHQLNQRASQAAGYTSIVNFSQNGLVIEGNKLRFLLKKEERMVRLRTVTP